EESALRNRDALDVAPDLARRRRRRAGIDDVGFGHAEIERRLVARRSHEPDDARERGEDGGHGDRERQTAEGPFEDLAGDADDGRLVVDPGVAGHVDAGPSAAARSDDSSRRALSAQLPHAPARATSAGS